MSSEYTYTALLDVLSYRNRLIQDRNSGKESFRELLTDSLSIFNDINNTYFSVQAISDTIIITCNAHERFLEFINILKKTFISFMNNGLYIRGGVAYAKHFHSGMITYSHAVAKAYEIESSKAVYPRIIIDKNILDMYSSGRSLPDIFDKGLLSSQNGSIFINILDEKNWASIYKQAKSIYENNVNELKGDEKAFIKHFWFESYLFSSRYSIDEKSRYVSIPNDV